METVGIFAALCVIFAFWHVAVTVIIYNALKKSGNPVSFLWLRVLAPKYAFQHKEITKAETGRISPLFFHWIVSINLALVFAIIAIIVGL